MTYIVKDECIKCKLTDCVEVCPVDCFYEGENMLVINPEECIDCGVCEPECPIDAIKADTDDSVNDKEKWLLLNKKFSAIWPNISKKKEPMKDHEKFKDLKNKFDEGKGLILVSIHNRSVDMLLKWINSQITTVSLYKRVKNKRLDKFVKRNREHDGALCYETTMLGVRNILKALKKNEAVCFAADQVPKRGMGEYINFFGRDAYSTTLVQSLAVKTKAAVLYLYINSSLTNFLSISIECCNNSIYDDSKHKLLLNNDIERIINKRPIDYSWEYKRFRRHPNPALDPYKNI